MRVRLGRGTELGGANSSCPKTIRELYLPMMLYVPMIKDRTAVRSSAWMGSAGGRLKLAALAACFYVLAEQQILGQASRNRVKLVSSHAGRLQYWVLAHGFISWLLTSRHFAVNDIHFKAAAAGSRPRSQIESVPGAEPQNVYMTQRERFSINTNFRAVIERHKVG
jgi:hypothetical protein